MASYLFSWKPSRWHWSDRQEASIMGIGMRYNGSVEILQRLLTEILAFLSFEAMKTPPMPQRLLSLAEGFG